MNTLKFFNTLGFIALALVAAVAETINLAVFPAIKATVETDIESAKAVIAGAEAQFAQDRQEAEADLQKQLAIINRSKETFAAQLVKAKADKTTAEQRQADEVAKNAQRAADAHASLLRQQATIQQQVAIYEQRRAAAQAKKTALEERKEHAEAAVSEAQARADQMERFFTALNLCAVNLKDDDSFYRGGLLGMAVRSRARGQEPSKTDRIWNNCIVVKSRE